MKLHLPSRKVLTVWRIRVLVAAALLTFLITLFFRSLSIVWGILMLCELVAFVYFYAFFFPIRFHKLSLAISEDHLILTNGTIYSRTRSVPIENIQYVGISYSPLERLFHICTLIVHPAGTSVRMEGLSYDEAALLQNYLTGNLSGGRWQS